MPVHVIARIPFLLTAILLMAQVARAQQDTTNRRMKGEREGYWIKYRSNGLPKWEGFYLHGERTGLWKFYDKDGTFHNEGRLVNGHRVGAWYLVGTPSGTKLDMTRWDGMGHCVGGATLSW